jgi:predicted lipoprotein with Yx(FWY)xxD motif
VKNLRIPTLLALALLATVAAAYASDESAPETEYTVNLATDEALGTFLVDGEGMTLYRFATDVPGSGASACYGTCAERWPAFFAQEIAVPAELEQTDFNGFERDDGTIQTTYKGWPLYYYFEDEAPGDVKGQGAGGVWFVISPENVPSE